MPLIEFITYRMFATFAYLCAKTGLYDMIMTEEFKKQAVSEGIMSEDIIGDIVNTIDEYHHTEEDL